VDSSRQPRRPALTTALDGRVFKPRPALVFFPQPLHIRARTIAPSVIAKPRPGRPDRPLHIRDRRPEPRRTRGTMRDRRPAMFTEPWTCPGPSWWARSPAPTEG